MSDEVYDPDGDVSRYLHSPSLDSHVLAAGDPVPAPVVVVGAPQHALPPAQGGVALPLPLPTPPAPAPPNLQSMAFGGDDVAQNHDAVPVDLQPMIDHLLKTMSLSDHSMDGEDDDDDDGVDGLMKSAGEDAAGNNGSTAVAEQHSVLPVEEGLAFVPFVAGQLDCSKCRPARVVLHQSANHKLYFVVHDDPVSAFQHAIIDRTYVDDSGQTILNELMYVDFRKRTLVCVQNFIANCVDMLKSDTSGQLTDSCSASSQTNKHIELEMAMLKEILSAPSSTTEAVGVPQSGPQFRHETVTRAEENTNADDTVLINAANLPVFSPAILESSQVSVQNVMLSSVDTSATDYESQLAKQRRRIAQLTIEDIAKLMHMSKKDAANELNISVTTLKRLCRKNNTDRWPARKINSLDSKIKKLQQAAMRNVGIAGLLAIKEKLEMLQREREQVFASVLRVMKENQKNNDCAGGSSG